jgi:hypothetical protein
LLAFLQPNRFGLPTFSGGAQGGERIFEKEMGQWQALLYGPGA